MRSLVAAGLALGLSVSAVAAPPPGAIILYDAGGFEDTSAFVAGNPLNGSDSGAWSQAADGNTPATIDTNITIQDQSVRVDRGNNGLGEWWVNIAGAPTVTHPIVVVEWSQYTVSTGSTTAYGPFFGVEVNNAGTFGVSRLGALYVDALDGSLWTLTSVDGQTTPTSGTFVDPNSWDYVTLDAWNQFKIETDFTNPNGEIRIYANGNLIYTDEFAAKNFSGADLTAFTDAAIKALFGNDDPASKAQTGTAYFDDYIVYMIPEPSSAALLGLAGLFLMQRRRAQR